MRQMMWRETAVLAQPAVQVRSRGSDVDKSKTAFTPGNQVGIGGHARLPWKSKMSRLKLAEVEMIVELSTGQEVSPI
jgi:hypothetical protein